jgi:hypothetical protein
MVATRACLFYVGLCLVSGRADLSPRASKAGSFVLGVHLDRLEEGPDEEPAHLRATEAVGLG